MKKILLASAVVFSTLSFAQIDFSSTRFGITAGGNYSGVKNAHNPSGKRFTVQAGVLALIPVGNENQFFLQPEIVYFGAGETGKNKDSKGVDGYDAVYANNYLSVPINFKGYFSEDESEFFGIVGPRFNFLLSQKVKNAPLSRPYYNPDVVDPALSNVNGKASSFNFGVGVGVGYSYKRQLELTAKYDFGISDTYPGLKNEPKGSNKNKSEQVLSLTLSYIFE
ncbi:Outer membrane protein beta-barrel domain-containing protein [Chryseobacterium soldanellicola]|uniref:Outer membrane protein beta-barrel domain-containing protein n=1 Tax=Chryseobacterium soldanellicola TaxID=311333 RepID=A0A1H1D8M7_9FLAO|nr:porin family protein [Chryseobacterium soldanellicola]SDQ72792.1 Outer membrane protein beta-barrel domain-containing protein [Chryseobacterium soldanellicola]